MNDSSTAARFWITMGAVLAGISVITGAFAAHGLDDYLIGKYSELPAKVIAGEELGAPYKYLQDFKTAAEYQMYHALGLLAVGVLSLRGKRKSLQVAGWSFLSGIILFSGSLYLLVLTGVFKLGAITPLGGVAFIVGWIALSRAALSLSSNSPGTPKDDHATV